MVLLFTITGRGSSSGSNSGSGSGQSSSNRTWLPDPGPTLGVNGQFDHSNTESNGVTYDYYTYDLDMTYDQMSQFIVVYTQALENMGFKATQDCPYPHKSSILFSL